MPDTERKPYTDQQLMGAVERAVYAVREAGRLGVPFKLATGTMSENEISRLLALAIIAINVMADVHHMQDRDLRLMFAMANLAWREEN